MFICVDYYDEDYSNGMMVELIKIDMVTHSVDSDAVKIFNILNDLVLDIQIEDYKE